MLTTESKPLLLSDLSAVSRVRSILEESGYLSIDSLERANKLSDIPAKKNTDEAETSEIFAKLFLLGLSLEVAVVSRVVHPMTVEDWMQIGLIHKDGGYVKAAVQLLVYRDLIIACDFKDQNISKNHVIGITPASHSLGRLTIRRRSGNTLDLGAGSGVQALLAASHSDNVVATDINQRAVNIAEFNAKLNRFGNVENITGDLFEPVAGRKFDLIVSCPPFVISPDNYFYYLDGGGSGDSLLERLIKESAGYLNEGGYCQVMCEVVQYFGQEWQKRLFGWLNGLGCDSWMLHRITMAPADYAKIWVADRSGSPDVLMREWLDYYKEQNIESITSGLLTLRKRSNCANWFRVDQLPDAIGDCGESIEQGFKARDFLDSKTDKNSFLTASLQLANDVQLNRVTEASPAGSTVAQCSLVFIKGFELSERIDDLTAEFLGKCKDNITVGRAITATEREIKQKVNRDEFVQRLGGLVLKGFLVQA